MPNWMNEIRRWCPSLKAFSIHGSKDERVCEAKSVAP
jgi:SNF2 family DNA or RNA helicase